MMIELSQEKIREFECHVTHEMLDKVGDEFEGRLSAEGVDVCGTIRRKGKDQYELAFDLTGEICYPCARCLDLIPTAVSYHYEETVECSEGADAINLVPYIEECLFINEPFKMLCDESCKGLCPGCGVNLNREACQCEETTEIDPRFESLKQLL